MSHLFWHLIGLDCEGRLCKQEVVGETSCNQSSSLWCLWAVSYRVQTSLPVCEVTCNTYSSFHDTRVPRCWVQIQQFYHWYNLSAVPTQWHQYCAHSSHDDARVIGPNDSISATPLLSPLMESILCPLHSWWFWPLPGWLLCFHPFVHVTLLNKYKVISKLYKVAWIGWWELSKNRTWI